MRSEQDKVLRAPLSVKFGDKDFPIKPLNITKAAEWRTLLNSELGPIADNYQAKNGQVSTGLAQALKEFPDKVKALIFAFDTTLDQQWISENATDEQMSAAFDGVLSLAFPYLAPLATVIKLIRPTLVKSSA